MKLSPIVLFVYNRLEHTHRTVEALQKNGLANESDLIIYSDAPKNSDEEVNVEKVREFVKTIDGFNTVRIIERERNYGLSQSIITGVTEVVNTYGKIIVLEDDLVTSPFFLKFMNDALDFYENEERVISIHGYTFPMKCRLPETFFIRGADCWGWATWKREWNLFEPDGGKLLAELRRRKLERKFDINGSYGYTKMLEMQSRKKIQSWAICWHASAFLNDKLTLYPGVSLINNVGYDGTGTHCVESDVYKTDIAEKPVEIKHIPVEENQEVLREFEKFLRSVNPSYFRLIKKSLGNFIQHRL